MSDKVAFSKYLEKQMLTYSQRNSIYNRKSFFVEASELFAEYISHWFLELSSWTNGEFRVLYMEKLWRCLFPLHLKIAEVSRYAVK